MMLSAKQCELARVMTKDTISDIQMNAGVSNDARY